ncbi:MAG TPA: signal recognition particle-docking protein FtsY [Burkholderiales bacterium]|nr:signal recognition particle-docking protein FtsY [Burkholderiales bacterium]
MGAAPPLGLEIEGTNCNVRLKSTEKKSLWQKIKDVALTDVGVLVRGMDEGSLEKLEELLIASDFGVNATMRLVGTVESLSRQGKIRTEEQFRQTVEQDIVEILQTGETRSELNFSQDGGPTVILMVGVNGVGKTTSIGKLAYKLKREGHRVLLAAGDTFRAGAIDQLRIWSERVGAEFVGAQPGGDPAAVAFDAIDAAQARNCDVIIIDSAGRLHTQSDLMLEIAKVERVIARKLPGAPHETLLVLDATVGQNAVAQARTFSQALKLSGLVLAKLDSSARGGVVVALKQEFGLPVKLVGTGEQLGDLEAFEPESFAQEVLSV